jgi:hypothetical protein
MNGKKLVFSLAFITLLLIGSLTFVWCFYGEDLKPDNEVQPLPARNHKS